MLALKANPNVLECLYSPLVEQPRRWREELLAMRAAFLSRLVYQTYNGYVMSQFRSSSRTCATSGEIKWKHAMHLIRLLLSGITVLREGVVPVRVDEHRDRLLAIRRGEMPWEEVERLAAGPAPRVRRGVRGDDAAGAARLRPGQRVPDEGPPEHGELSERRHDATATPTANAIASRRAALSAAVRDDQRRAPLRLPSPDSDYDLRGVHVLPLRDVLGLNAGRETIEFSGRCATAVEIDLVTHDVRKFFLLLLKKNGYVLEQLYSPLVVHTTPEHEELKAIARRLHHAAPRAITTSASPRRSGSCSKGAPAAGQAAALRLPRAAHRHPPDAHGRGRGEPRAPERGVPAAVRPRPDRAQD